MLFVKLYHRRTESDFEAPMSAILWNAASIESTLEAQKTESGSNLRLILVLSSGLNLGSNLESSLVKHSSKSVNDLYLKSAEDL